MLSHQSAWRWNERIMSIRAQVVDRLKWYNQRPIVVRSVARWHEFRSNQLAAADEFAEYHELEPIPVLHYRCTWPNICSHRFHRVLLNRALFRGPVALLSVWLSIVGFLPAFQMAWFYRLCQRNRVHLLFDLQISCCSCVWSETQMNKRKERNQILRISINCKEVGQKVGLSNSCWTKYVHLYMNRTFQLKHLHRKLIASGCRFWFRLKCVFLLFFQQRESMKYSLDNNLYSKIQLIFSVAQSLSMIQYLSTMH